MWDKYLFVVVVTSKYWERFLDHFKVLRELFRSLKNIERALSNINLETQPNRSQSIENIKNTLNYQCLSKESPLYTSLYKNCVNKYNYTLFINLTWISLYIAIEIISNALIRTSKLHNTFICMQILTIFVYYFSTYI